ncbi:hypothetical protein F1D05_33230 [Kribbella qitaiheensis]|uniref:Uncharacterized protein n=1 Tax=Kribbella qitaiheensis TaxID=1544730 RepID=A0A7G6X6M6_9ACTN|nr:hypothetical protein [Kribbella qitaiheensis]QNE21891.1 hypothetical protein F1D05_33230 [Kribbella qitaiheensis]
MVEVRPSREAANNPFVAPALRASLTNADITAPARPLLLRSDSVQIMSATASLPSTIICPVAATLWPAWISTAMTHSR